MSSCFVKYTQTEYCLEWTYPQTNDKETNHKQFSTLKRECDNLKGWLYMESKCERKGNIGGCTQGGKDKDSLTNLVWFYYEGTSMKAERIPQFCAAQKEEFVSP